jgi:hypothetical protein
MHWRRRRGKGINYTVHVAVYLFVNVYHFFIIAGERNLSGGEGCGGGSRGGEFCTGEDHFQFLFCNVFSTMMTKA